MTDISHLRHDGGSPSPYEIVEEFWPYDGARDPYFTSSAATAVAHLVRYLNNSTQYAAAVPDGPTLGRVVSQLSGVVYGLDQLLAQLATAAERIADDPTLYDHNAPREQGGVTARELASDLIATRYRLRDLREPIDHANQLGGTLGHRSEGES